MRKYESHKMSISKIGDIVATYLDEDGLAEVWSKVQSLVSSSGGGVTTLYNNSSGSSGTVTLSQSVNNFKFLVLIAYLSSNSRYAWVVECSSNNTACWKQNGFELVRVSAYAITSDTKIYKVFGV